MSIRVLPLLAVLTGCLSEAELEWTNTRAAPDGAAETLAARAPPLLQRMALDMAGEYFHYVIEWEWHGSSDGWGTRHGMKSSYDRALAKLDAMPRGRRFVGMAELVYDVGSLYISMESTTLAETRIVRLYPHLAEEIGEVLPLDDDELVARANALEAELRDLRRRYRGFIGWTTACAERIDEHDWTTLKKLDNARGDLRVTTGPLLALFREHSIPVAPLTDFDRGLLHMPCRNPWEPR